jgi:hypothetical protein
MDKASFVAAYRWGGRRIVLEGGYPFYPHGAGNVEIVIPDLVS